MINKLKNLAIAVLISLSGSLVLVPAVAQADFTQDACSGVGAIEAGSCGKNSTDKISNVVKTVTTVLSFIVGFAAVIMIIFSGLKFINAGGDANSIASARSSLIYAIIGLAIVGLAQLIVHFTIAHVKG